MSKQNIFIRAEQKFHEWTQRKATLITGVDSSHITDHQKQLEARRKTAADPDTDWWLKPFEWRSLKWWGKEDQKND